MVPSLVFFSLNDSTLGIVVFWIPLYLHSAAVSSVPPPKNSSVLHYIYSVNSFNKYLLSAYYVPDILYFPQSLVYCQIDSR